MLDAATESTIARVTEDLRHAFGRDLVSVALYGSAAGEDFVAGRSNLNFAILFEQLAVAHLDQLHALLPRWHKLGVATPLLLTREELHRARDVFPMEFCDLKAQHRVLYGEPVFATLEIDRRHLRFAAEHEARSKLLRLRCLYAELRGDAQRLEALVLDSVKTFAILMRNFIRLRAGEGARRYLDVLAQFEQHFALRFPTMQHLLRIKLGQAEWTEPARALFPPYLAEVERLVELVDRVLPDSDSPRG